jgi:membrane-associated protease RseP (regulator of RpoE activity)
VTTLAAFALVITVLVFIHELGHFLAARWFGVPVEVFSIGFGPSLFSIRRGGVEYRLSAIPFGGYVKMAGSSPMRGEAVPDGFDSKAPWQRFLILFAGPAMNVAFALVLVIVALWAGIEVPVERNGVATTEVYRPAPMEAFPLGVQVVAENSARILSTVGGLVTGQISVSHLMGPVGLAQVAGESSQLGWRALLAAMAFISLNLGICNLLPIPILDGGHMLMLVVEGVTRRSMSFRVRKVLLSAGAAAMLMLLATTLFNDLGRLGLLTF